MSRLDLLQIECERGNFHHVNDTSESKEMSMQFCADMKDALIELSTLTAKVKRYEEVFNKEFFLNIITEWKFSWMNQRQNDQKDYENYHRRAFGVDANMKHDLASRLARAALNQGED